MTGPRFSIIIPHYDIPDLLMRCLDSIPVSEDIQVIVVDDNSPGAESYLQKYPALSRPCLNFVRAPRNGGAGYARNVGLERATGEWLLFADADDFFAEGMHDMIASRQDTDADVVFFRKKGVYSDDVHRESDQDAFVDAILDHYFQTGDELPVRTRWFVPWGKMIRRDLVVSHNIRFDEVKYSNDCYFSACVGCYAKSIDVSEEVLYYKTYRPGSLATGFCSKPDELRIRTEVAFRTDRFLFQHGLCRERENTVYLLLMLLKQDKPLFFHYFNRLDEIYPSRYAAITDLCKARIAQIRHSSGKR